MPAFLARRYAEPVTVERRDDRPAAVVWRDRDYVVGAVLDHWWQTGPWWRAVTGSGADDEREFWRVELERPGHRASASPPAVVELCFSWSTGTWTVTAVLD